MIILAAVTHVFSGCGFTEKGVLPEKSDLVVTLEHMRSIEGCLDMFQENPRTYPTVNEWLFGTTNMENYVEGKPLVFQMARKDVRDGWNRDFVYVFPGKRNTNSYDLYSLGEDGKSKTGGDDPDDLNNWDLSAGIDYYRNAGMRRAVSDIHERKLVLRKRGLVAAAFAGCVLIVVIARKRRHSPGRE